MKNDESIRDDGWQDRVLCSDGNCIGVIGPDGRCKECGKSYEGGLPVDVSEQAAESTHLPVDEVSCAETQPADLEQGPTTASDDEWSERTLCRDEACIGIVGSDGRCKECGLPFSE